MRKRWLLGIGIGCLLVGAAVVLFEPTGIVLGRLNRESFYRGRPTRYWKKGLQSPDPVRLSETLRTLREGGAEAVPVLVELLREDATGDWTNAEVRWRAAELLGEIGAAARAAVGALTEALQDRDPHVRSVAAVALAAVAPGDPETIPTFAGLLHGNDRLVALRALSKCGPQARSVVPAVAGLLEDPELEVRWNAARTLANIGPEAREAVPALVAALQDSEALVREHSAEALGQLGADARDAVPALIRALRDKEARVRRDAARSLGQIGRTDAEVILVLRKLLEDDSSRVRDAAQQALSVLDRDSPPRKEPP